MILRAMNWPRAPPTLEPNSRSGTRLTDATSKETPCAASTTHAIAPRTAAFAPRWEVVGLFTMAVQSTADVVAAIRPIRHASPSEQALDSPCAGEITSRVS